MGMSLLGTRPWWNSPERTHVRGGKGAARPRVVVAVVVVVVVVGWVAAEWPSRGVYADKLSNW